MLFIVHILFFVKIWKRIENCKFNQANINTFLSLPQRGKREEMGVEMPILL